MHMGVDLETYSSVDIGKSGVYAYADSPDFEILLIGYTLDNGETVKVIDLTSDYNEDDMNEFLQYLNDPTVLKTAFNANFERTCLAKYFNTECPPEQWQCSAVYASMLGLPRSLGGVCEALGLPSDKAKDKIGKSLIQYFCKPCKPTKANGGRTRNLPEHDPEKWNQFIEYNRQDVVAEQAVLDRISFYKITDLERRLWVQDQALNDRGVLVNVPMIKGIIEYDNLVKERLINEASALTCLENPNSPTQLKQWLEGRGITVDKLSKETIPDIINSTDDQTVKRVLEIRLSLSKTSTKKYDAMMNAKCSDDRVRGLMVLYGANRTGRWASRIVQLQNLSKNHLPDIDDARQLCCDGEFEMMEMLFGEPSSVFSELVRTAFIASPGNRFVIADFSAIEARVISWVAGEEWRMEVFRTHGKIYEAAASQMFHVPIESIKKGSKLRQQGKVAELACIAEGQEVLTDRGLVPIEDVKLTDKVWDGLEFVSHEGVVCRGEKEVITYGGLTATKDHLVWVEGARRPIRFEQSASSGSHLLQTGDGGRTIRICENYKPREKMGRKMEQLLRINRVPIVRKNMLDVFVQLKKRKVKGLSEMLTTAASASVARQKVYSSKTKMHKSKRRKLQELRRERDRVQVRISNGSMPLYDKREWSSGTEYGNRSNRRERPLRKRQSEMGHTSTELPKSAKVYDIINCGPRHRFTVSGVLVHNCGYQGGVGALRRMDPKETIPDEELPEILKTWRNANPHIVKLWSTVEKAAKTAIKQHRIVKIRHDISFSYEHHILFAQLPSGRKLSYYDARLENIEGKETITYAGTNQISKKWSRISTYGGKLVENIIQAIARDCLAVTMIRLEDKGYNVVFHIHDEVIIDVPKEDNGALKTVLDIFSEPISWAPGLYLKGDGYESPYYLKD